MTDVSDAIEKLFSEFIEPALITPGLGKSQPKLPLPDTFRANVCYNPTPLPPTGAPYLSL